METIAEAAEALRTYVHETARAHVLGTLPPPVDDLKEILSALEDADEPDAPECSCFEGLRWLKMSQAERRDILVRLKKWADTTDDQPRSLAIDSVIEALQRVSETEGVL